MFAVTCPFIGCYLPFSKSAQQHLKALEGRVLCKDVCVTCTDQGALTDPMIWELVQLVVQSCQVPTKAKPDGNAMCNWEASDTY